MKNAWFWARWPWAPTDLRFWQGDSMKFWNIPWKLKIKHPGSKPRIFSRRAEISNWRNLRRICSRRWIWRRSSRIWTVMSNQVLHSGSPMRQQENRCRIGREIQFSSAIVRWKDIILWFQAQFWSKIRYSRRRTSKISSKMRRKKKMAWVRSKLSAPRQKLWKHREKASKGLSIFPWEMRELQADKENKEQRETKNKKSEKKQEGTP